MKWGSSSASDGTVNIERLLKLQVTLDWQEAVAIVLETAEVLERERRRSMPTQRNIVLTPTGTVEFAKGRTQSGSSVSALAQTLGALLSTDHPTQLRLILSTAGPNSSSYKNVSEFSEALKYFERPGRRNMISEVHARALKTPVPLARSEMTEEVKKPRRRKRPGRLRHALAPLAGAAAVFAAIAAVVLFVEYRDPGVVSGPAEQLQEQATAAWSIVRDSAAEDLAELLERAKQIGPEAEVTTEAESESASHRDDRPSGVADLARAVADPAPTAPARSAPVAVASAPAGSAPDPLVAAAVFDTTDDSVTPPVTLNRRFPQVPAGRYETRRNNEGLVEAVVSATGHVETVKLIHPPNTIHESMILSAIKTWQFQPATKDGHPVRYRQLITVALP